MSEIMDLKDAIRALRDRPSMERELQELREKCERLERSGAVMAVGLLAQNAIEAGECTHCGDLVDLAVEEADTFSGEYPDAYAQALNGEGEE